MPLFSSTPHENHMALDRFRAVSSFSFRASLNRPNGLNRSNRYSITATMWTESKTSSHKLIWKGRRNESRLFLLDSFKDKDVIKLLYVCNSISLSDSLKFSKQKYGNTNLIYQFRLVGGLWLTVYLTNKLNKWLMDGLMAYKGDPQCRDLLKDWRADGLMGWRSDGLTGRRIDSLMDWRADRLTRLTNWRADRLTRLTNWRADRLRTDGLTGRRTNSLTGREIDGPIDGQASGLTDWRTGRLRKGGLKDERTDEVTQTTQRNTDRGKHVRTDTRMHGENWL